MDLLVGEFVVQMLVEQACEVSVHALISADQFIREGEAWHQTPLLEPEDRTEAPTEEDSLHTGKGNQALGKRAVGSNPLESPICLLLYRRNILDGIEQEVFLGSVRNVCVDNQRIGLRMNILHHHLEAIEASCLWDLDLCHEPLGKVFKYNSIGGSEESENHLDEMLLVSCELGPILEILLQIDFFSGPESSHLLLVHPPDVSILDRQNHEAVWVLLQQGLWQ